MNKEIEDIGLKAFKREFEGHFNHPKGIYVASRCNDTRVAMWKYFRDEMGVNITSSWIDEAGQGETKSFSELWIRILDEIGKSERLILFAETEDFPLKGALVEVGVALALGIPVTICLPDVVLEGRTHRPIGSWINHPLVNRNNNLLEAFVRPPEETPDPRVEVNKINPDAEGSLI